MDTWYEKKMHVRKDKKFSVQWRDGIATSSCNFQDVYVIYIYIYTLILEKYFVIDYTSFIDVVKPVDEKKSFSFSRNFFSFRPASEDNR